MADNSETNAGNSAQKSEQLLKLIKRRFENWRELLIHIHEILIWEKPYYPGIIAGVVSVIFLMLWYFDPSVLTALSAFGIIICLADYFVPIISASLFDPSKWTGIQERKYEEICRMIIGGYMNLEQMCDSVHQIKESKPYLYVIGVVGFLAFTAWIGNLINNLFLTYMMVLFALLAPGIKSQQMVQNALGSIRGMLGQSKKKK